MEGMYGAAKYCPKGPESCKDQTQLTDIMANSRNYDELTEAWTGWHSTARPMRKDYVRFVELANEGARELGFADLGAMWRSNYDMPPDEFTKEAARLWDQVKPLYGSLHCYVRGKLQKTYGAEHVPNGKPIPAQLLGNMWAQQWGEIYPLVEPYPGVIGSQRHRRAEETEVRCRCASRSRRRTSTCRSASRSCRRLSGSARCSPSRAIATCSVTPARGTWTARKTCASSSASSRRRNT